MANCGGFKHWCFLIVLHATKNSSLSGFIGVFSGVVPCTNKSTDIFMPIRVDLCRWERRKTGKNKM